MASIIPGYEYDIFISYRQKDNKGDRWVSEFVEALRTELESTFKEEISVYFDINPHDGLLETHDVDASLKEKLKCLVFIPIISRTYCDPKSFAWEHEFKAFVEQASKDQFGLRVKLPNSNVASRVLPVRIHDLDPEDIKQCELVLGGVLRGVDFIYKSAGVNRPLRVKEEKPQENLNNTLYRDQINKVANSIKQIIKGLLSEPSGAVKEEDQPGVVLTEMSREEKKTYMAKASIAGRVRVLSTIAILAGLVIAAIFAFPKLFRQDNLKSLKDDKGRISVAVLPFQNMTNDTTWNVWQDGIQNILISSLSNSEELKVRQAESIDKIIQSEGLTNYASITPSVAGTISRKLDASVFIRGSLKKAGSRLRLNAELIDSKTEEIYKSFEIEGPATEDVIFHITDSLRRMIRNSLIISSLEKELPDELTRKIKISTDSVEAFRNFIYGRSAFEKSDFVTAADYFTRSLAVDSGFTAATLYLAYSYINMPYDLTGLPDAKKMCLRLYNQREQMPLELQIRVKVLYAYLFETPYDQIKYLRQLLELDDQWPATYLNIAAAYHQLGQYDRVIPLVLTALNIYEKWDPDLISADDYNLLGYAYHKTEQFRKEKKTLKKAEEIFPDDPDLIRRLAVMYFHQGDSVKANNYVERYRSDMQEKSWPEADITTLTGLLFTEADLLDKAEECFRQALKMRSDDSNNYINLAWFLIERDLNAEEALTLLDKAQELGTDEYVYLHFKGWGLFKLGKYEEALDLMQKSWDMKPIYVHDFYLHLEEAKKAVAGQKND